jgi:hypothetical protein
LRFAVRRPAQQHASPRSHRPPDGDVACRVHIRMIQLSADATAKDRLALAVFRSAMSTGATGLRCVRGIDPFHPARSFVFEAGYQPAPPGRMNGAVQSGFGSYVFSWHVSGAARGSDHVPNLQVLYADHLETASEICGGLFHPVLTSVRLAGLQPGDLRLDASPSIRSSRGAGQSSFEAEQTLCLSVAQAADAQKFASGQGRRHRDTAINADDRTVSRPFDRWRDNGECDVPAPRTVSRDPVGPGAAGDGARPAESDPTDLRHPYFADPAGRPADIPLGATFSNDSESFVPRGFAPCRPAVSPGEEVRRCLGEIPQRLLLHRLRTVRQPCEFAPCFGQLAALLYMSRRTRPPRPPISVLFHREIPDKAGMSTMLQQRCLLNGRGLKPESHAKTLSTATDIPRGGRRVRPGFTAGPSVPCI